MIFQKQYIYLLLSILIWGMACKKDDAQIKQNRSEIHNGENKINVFEQPTYIRKWVNCELLHIYDLSGDSLFNPIQIQIDQSDNLYVFEFATQKIKRYSSPAQVTEYGNGKGEGPEEFLNITDFCFYEDFIYICDGQLGKVSTFKLDGTFIKTVKLINSPHRIVILKELIIVKPIFGSEGMYDIYDKNFNKINSFGDIPSLSPMEKPMLSDGKICSDNSNNIYYGFRYISQIFLYNLDTQSNYFIKTIDNSPKPELEVIAGGKGVRAPRNKPVPCLNISYTNNKLYVLSYAGEGITEKKPVIDVYNAENGFYLFTFRIPFQSAEVQIKEDMLYAIYDGTKIGAWRLIFSDKTIL